MALSQLIRKSRRKLGRLLIASRQIWQEWPGVLLECRLKLSDKPLVFQDWAGNRYWQYPGDPIRRNWARKAVTDASHVMRYVLDHARPGWICVDIGANIGAVSVSLWSRVGAAGRVISVEADPNNIGRIEANLKLNHFPTDYVVHVAMADQKGGLQLRCYPEANGWQTLGDPPFARNYESFTVDVPAMSFQELALSQGIEAVDLAKIDVEGAEILVLKGMRPFLEEKRIKCLVFEVNHLMLEGLNYRVGDLWSFWSDLDYELWRLADDGTPVAIGEAWPEDVIGDCIAFARP